MESEAPIFTIYTTSICQNCKKTKDYLNKRGASYKEVNIEVDEGARDFVTDLGYRAAPVVLFNDEDGAVLSHWSGFNKKNIDESLESDRESVFA